MPSPLEVEQVAPIDDFYAGGPKTFQEAFPPFCVKSHWDPTQLHRHVLPGPATPYVPMPTDPRQHVKVCTRYYNESPADKLPEGLITAPEPMEIPEALRGPAQYTRMELDASVPTPPGGAAGRGAPYATWAAAVDQESDVFRLDEPLTRCKERRYTPKELPKDDNMLAPSPASSRQGPKTFAEHTHPSLFVTKAVPQPMESMSFDTLEPALFVTQRAGCRDADDQAAWNRSARLFFNHTKLDRYHPDSTTGPLAC